MELAIKTRKRSPLKDRPLRLPGQSLDAAIDDHRFDLLGYMLAPSLLAIFAALEWWRGLIHDSFHPWIYTCLTIGALGWFGWLAWRKAGKILELRQGREGERIAAEGLETLREYGYSALHDLVGGKFNLDHVLIGPSGIYAVETKTLSKRGGANERAVFDGKQILIGGGPLPRDPLAQARRNARWLSGLLAESTGKTFRVTPLVLLPGWYVETTSPVRDALVLNAHPNTLRALLVSRSTTMHKADVHLARFHLQRFVRAAASR